MQPVIVCVGLTTIDFAQVVDALPAPNAKMIANDAWFDVGGPAANAARIASREGCRVKLVTALGDSTLAALARERLASIEIIDIAPPTHQIPVSTIFITPDGGRSVVSRNAAGLSISAKAPNHEPGANADDARANSTPHHTPAEPENPTTEVVISHETPANADEPSPHAGAGHNAAGRTRPAPSTGSSEITLPDPKVLDGADVVLHDGHLLDASLALAANPSPIHVLDGGSWKPGLEDLLPMLDIAVVSSDFALPGSDPEHALSDLATLGIPRLARSRGGKPLQAMIGEQLAEFPVPEVEVVDSTGAGDVLHGSLIAQLASGTDFTAALRQAIVQASESVTHYRVL